MAKVMIRHREGAFQKLLLTVGAIRIHVEVAHLSIQAHLDRRAARPALVPGGDWVGLRVTLGGVELVVDGERIVYVLLEGSRYLEKAAVHVEGLREVAWQLRDLVCSGGRESGSRGHSGAEEEARHFPVQEPPTNCSLSKPCGVRAGGGSNDTIARSLSVSFRPACNCIAMEDERRVGKTENLPFIHTRFDIHV